MIAALRAKGLVIHSVEKTGLDRDGQKIYYGVYSIDECSVDRATELVEEYEQREGLV
ncbi:hypothetical protein [Marinobacter guineae]|uniref:hypothetical protein n=1 Tax=Marinobacter guineae TaxID=432303 RepID=UPI0014762F7E|nr:hypothetical protein [Marinobacter guineae]